jgi:hypothetical protein
VLSDKSTNFVNDASGTDIDNRILGTTAPKETTLDGSRYDQATRSGQRVRVHSRRWRAGVVLPPQFGARRFDQLNEGQRVGFEEEPSAKGPRAGNVRSEG